MALFDIFRPQKRKYEAAAKTKRTSGWWTGGGDANAQIMASLATLQQRSRDLRRNNPWGHKAIESVTNHVVGAGVKTIISGPNKEFLQREWDKWVKAKSFDYDGKLDIYAIQRLIMDSTVESGEVLVRKRTVNENYPFQYQVLESDFLSSSELNGKTQTGNTIIQGVEFNASGKIVNYHLYETHPGSVVTTTSSLSTNPIPANQVMHIFRQERPGQVRGVPWLAPVMIRMRDLDDFEDAQLMRQKIAALFTAFVHDISAEVECEDTSDFGEKMEPGIIEELPPGKDVKFADPPGVENYKEYVTQVLHAIAAGIGISYEALTGDFSDSNYSASRLAALLMDKNVTSWRKAMLILGFLDEVVEDFKTMMAIKGVVISDNTVFAHIPPKREMIDPTKEVPSTIQAIRAGLSTLSDEIAATGKDPDKTMEKWAEDQEKTENLGLKLKSNPKYTSDNGKLQENGESQEENDEQEN